MKSAIVAVHPALSEERSEIFELCRKIRGLQDRGLIRASQAVAILHPGLYPYPYSYFQRSKSELAKECRENLQTMLEMDLFESISVVTATSSDAGSLVEKLSDHTQWKSADILVMGNPGPRAMGWLFGGLTEEAVRSAQVPVLVLNWGKAKDLRLSEPEIVVGIDPKRRLSESATRLLLATAEEMKAGVHLVAVISRRGRGRIPQLAKRELALWEVLLAERGIAAQSVVLYESGSVASTLERYAESVRASLIAVGPPRENLLRQFLGHSVSVRLVDHAKRPVLVLRGKTDPF